MHSTWEARYSVGLQTIDAQHREILAAVATLDRELTEGTPDAQEKTIEFLSRTILVHFEEEERWMRRARFSERREHVARHDEFLKKLLAMTQEFADAGSSTVLKLRLRNALAWIEDHVAEDDVALGRHLQAKAAVEERKRAPVLVPAIA